MLTAHHLNKSFEIHTILEDICFSIHPGEKVGLVGPNGCGKTTLMRILAGEDQPDSGSVQFSPSDLVPAYLPQAFPLQEMQTIGEFLESPEVISDELSATAEKLGITPDQPALQDEYDRLLHKLANADRNAGKTMEALSVMELAQYPQDTTIGLLSGGQKTRLSLVKTLLSSSPMILMDEPTNHLDMEMLSWLENWMAHTAQTVLVVSHDRTFLNQTVNRILELDPKTRRLRSYDGNYDTYEEWKEMELEKQWQAFQDQQDEIAKIKDAARHVRSLTRFRKGGKGDTRDAWSPGFFANRTMETMRRAKNLEKRLEKLTGEERVDRPEQTWQMRMEFSGSIPSNREIARFTDVVIGYPGIVLIEPFTTSIRYGDRIALLGQNGSGKTSLLRTMLSEIRPLEGEILLGNKTRIGYMPQEHPSLPGSSTPLEVIQEAGCNAETAARNLLSKYLFKGDEVFVQVKKLSYGEKARLLLAKLVTEGSNFLVLDEPINHLDIPSRIQFEQALRQFEGAVLAVVHDRSFMHDFANQVWRIERGCLTQVPLIPILDLPAENSLLNDG